MAGEQFDNDFTAGKVSKRGQTKPLDVLLLDYIDGSLRETHVAVPAEITAVQAQDKVTVKILLKRKFKNGDIVDLPLIPDVPVIMPRTQTSWVKLPLAIGDTGQLVVNERSIDKWKVSGGSVDPQDTRKHSFSDGVFYPGLYPFSSPLISGEATDMVLHNGIADLFLQAAGTFKITNGGVEAFDLIDQFITIVNNIVTDLNTFATQQAADFTAQATAAGTAPLTPLVAGFTALATASTTLSTQLAAVMTQLAELQVQWDTLKSEA